MGSVAPAWYQDPSVLLALGEVHDPRHGWTIEGEDSLARLRFFGSIGAQVLDVPFVQPALAPGLRRVPNFLLLAFAVKDAALVTSEPPAVDRQLVGKFIQDYFDHCEGPVTGSPDAPLAALLEHVAAKPGVALLPFDRYVTFTTPLTGNDRPTAPAACT